MIHNLCRLLGLISIVAIAMLASSCAETTRPVAGGKGSVRGIAAIADFPDAFFLIEERQIGLTTFKGVAGFVPYDDLSYNFSFDYLIAGDEELTRLASQFVDVVANTEYTVVLTGTIADPVTLLWEEPVREWEGTETVLEPTFAHLSPTLGDVDIYFSPLGTPPALGSEVGTLTYGERLGGTDYPDGMNELIITTAGMPANILYRSGELISTAQTRPLYAIFDADPSITAPVAVNLITEGGASVVIPDRDVPAQLRFYHAAFGTENVDVYFDDDFGTKIFSDVGFDELSSYSDVMGIAPKMSMTAVDNSGAVILESNIGISPGSRLTISMVGDPASLALTGLADSARQVATAATFRIAHMAANLDFVNIYILDPGAEIDQFTQPVFVALGPAADTGTFELAAGAHEITLTGFASGTLDPIAPKVTLDASLGDIIEIAILNTADPSVYELSVYSRTP